MVCNVQTALAFTENQSMKIKTKLFVFIVLLALLALPASALAATSGENIPRGVMDEFVLGGNFTLPSGETLRGNLWIMGGNASLESGSRVTGDVMLLGGNVNVDGEISGDINVMGGNIDLRNQAVVRGDLNIIGGAYNRSTNARIEGNVNTGPTGPFQFMLPSGVRVPAVEVRTYPLWEVISFFFRTFLVAALAVLAVMFWPRHIQRIGQTSISQPVAAGGLGLLTAVVAPIILLIMTITIILIPVTLVGLALLALMALLGWIAIGLEVGERLAASLNQEWALPVSAGVGTLIFSIVAIGIDRLVPCVGWVVPVLLGMIGLGAVILTRFGTQSYPGQVLPPPPPSGPRTPVSPYSTPSTPAPVAPEPAPWEEEARREENISSGAVAYPSPPGEEPEAPEIPTAPPEHPYPSSPDVPPEERTP
jgi:hypothetical protein